MCECEYCEKQKEIKSCNFGGRASMRVLDHELNVWGDEKILKMFKTIYNPAFRINYCPMCGRQLNMEHKNYR